MQADIDEMQTAARHLGLTIVVVEADNKIKIDTALTNAVQQGATVAVVGHDPFLISLGGRISSLAHRRHAIRPAECLHSGVQRA